MNIKEAEKITGVSSRNIRFYEQKGLLTPARNKENDYREYSDEDIQSLMLIRALRMLDMPIDTIREVMDGSVPLQMAARQQEQKLQSEMDKMQITIQFCRELSQMDQPNIPNLLSRMDAPENRDKLSDKWPRDYHQTVRTGLLAFVTGVIPVGWGCVMARPMMLAVFLHESAVLALSMLLPLLWVYLGYRFVRWGRWWLSFLFAHVLPGVVCGLMHWQMQLPQGQRIGWLTDLGLGLQNGLMYFAVSKPWLQEFLPILWALMGCFVLGGLIGWLAPIFRYGFKEVYGKRKSKFLAFVYRINRIVPLKFAAMMLAITLPIVIVMGNMLFGPLPTAVTTDRLAVCLSDYTQIEVELAGETYTLSGNKNFCRQFQLEKWDRNYFGSSNREVVLEIHLSPDRSEPYAIVIYADGKVRVYESWITTQEGYYWVPEGVVEDIRAYVLANGT